MSESDLPFWASLPVEGYKIVGVEFWRSDVTLIAETSGEGGPIKIGWGGPVQIRRPDGSRLALDGTWQAQAELLSWQDAEIESLNVDSDSNLALRLRNGWTVDIPPNPDAEAWELFGPGEDEKRFAAAGGGEPSVDL